MKQSYYQRNKQAKRKQMLFLLNEVKRVEEELYGAFSGLKNEFVDFSDVSEMITLMDLVCRLQHIEEFIEEIL